MASRLECCAERVYSPSMSNLVPEIDAVPCKTDCGSQFAIILVLYIATIFGLTLNICLLAL